MLARRNLNLGHLSIILLVTAIAPQAHATETVAPTGEYVPPQQTEQHANINVGGYSIKATNEGATINIPGIGSIKADRSGADIEINSDADLKLYTAQVLAKNNSITSIVPSATEISVSYIEPGKLFGFIPVSMPSQLSVSSHGEVHQTLPWYSFLVSSSAAKTKEALVSLVSSTPTTFDPSAQVHIIANISGAISGTK